MTRKNAFISNKMQLQNHSSTFIYKNKSLLSATSIPSCSHMAYNTTNSLDQLTCIDYVDFGESSDRFGQLSWSKNDSKYLDVKLNVFKKDDNKEFRLIHLQWEMQESLTPLLIPTRSRDMDEQLKLAHKVVDVVDRKNRKICVTLLRYSVDKPESSYAQVRLIERKKGDEKFQ